MQRFNYSEKYRNNKIDGLSKIKMDFLIYYFLESSRRYSMVLNYSLIFTWVSYSPQAVWNFVPKIG